MAIRGYTLAEELATKNGELQSRALVDPEELGESVDQLLRNASAVYDELKAQNNAKPQIIKVSAKKAP